MDFQLVIFMNKYLHIPANLPYLYKRAPHADIDVFSLCNIERFCSVNNWGSIDVRPGKLNRKMCSLYSVVLL